MTASHIASPPRRDTFAVIPVVEYEPPTRDVPRCRPSSHAAALRHISTASGRPGEFNPGGKFETDPRAPAAPALSPAMRQAAAFADSALRRVLEVIDRRRPAAALRPLLAPALVDSVLAVGRSSTTQGGAAVLRRVRLQPVGPHPNTAADADAAAEVSGSYSRGDRVHAIACRVERAPRENTTNGSRWLLVALHIG